MRQRQQRGGLGDLRALVEQADVEARAGETGSPVAAHVATTAYCCTARGARAWRVELVHRTRTVRGRRRARLVGARALARPPTVRRVELPVGRVWQHAPRMRCREPTRRMPATPHAEQAPAPAPPPPPPPPPPSPLSASSRSASPPPALVVQLRRPLRLGRAATRARCRRPRWSGCTAGSNRAGAEEALPGGRWPALGGRRRWWSRRWRKKMTATSASTCRSQRRRARGRMAGAEGRRAAGGHHAPGAEPPPGIGRASASATTQPHATKDLLLLGVEAEAAHRQFEELLTRQRRRLKRGLRLGMPHSAPGRS